MNTYGTEYFEPIAQRPGLNGPAVQSLDVLDFQLLVMAAGDTHAATAEAREFGLVVLTGTVDITVNGTLYAKLGGRKTVFDGPPSMIYVPVGAEFAITATSGAEVALCSCPSDNPDIAPYRLDPKDAIQGRWGQFNTTRRYNYMINSTRPSARLHLAEVTVESGNWATFPPHKHDETVPERGEIFQEETYFYRIDHPEGFGFCATYGGKAETDYAFVIRNNSLHKMPRGYHTLCAAPGYRVWYLAAIAGHDKRHAVHVDPAHAWAGRAEVFAKNVRDNLLGLEK